MSCYRTHLLPFSALTAILCCLTLTGAASNASAQSELRHFAPDAAALYQQASQVAPPANSDVLVLENEQNIVFDAEGKFARTRYLLYKVLTQRGAEEWASLSYTWEPWHEQRPVLHARVITPDYAMHPLDLATVTDSPARDTEESVFSDRRVLRAPLPSIAPGSLVEEEESDSESTAFFGAGSVERFYFGFSAPLHHARLILDAPSTLPLRYHAELLPDLKPQRTEADGRLHIIFDVGPLEPFEELDPGLPSDVPAYPNITFSTASSWQAVAEQYSQIVDTQIAGDVKSLVSRLTSGKSSREEKAAALLQYVSREIRYTGVEFADAAVVPRSPTETLTRKYGDCKDKSSLLVALFRATNIPAYIALLNVGGRVDVTPDLPGMGMFDHAVVYAPGPPDLWIDATDEYARVGQLPVSDQDRLSLIARNGTNELIRTPLSSSAENALVEKREIYLAENGPARIIETSFPHGGLESWYRRSYADKQSKTVKEDLTNYAKVQYLADKVDRIDRSDPADLSKQFELVIETDKARLGSTELNVAAAAIRFDTLFGRLPSDLQQRGKEPDPKAESEPGAKPEKKRTADYQLRDAFITEWQYTIVPPVGFKPKPLPKNIKRSLGPGLFTEEFSAAEDGVVHATVRFDMVKRRLTAAEVTDLRNSVAEVREGGPVLIYFDPIGQTLLNQGKVREALQSYRDLIALHPKEGVHHLQLAMTLLQAGMGESARSEAQTAIKLEPKAALAQKTLAQVLEYDRVGRKLRPGSDFVGAEAALRAAEALDPDDNSTIGDLAILLEYDSWGARYSPSAPLKESIAEYRKLTPEKLAELGLRNNLAFTLFYAGEFSEAEKNAQSLNPPPLALIVACEAALNGSREALAEVRKRSSGDDQFKQIAKAAGDMLANVGNYSAAADLLEAGASGEKASNIAADASMFRRTQPHAQIIFPDDPVGTALRFHLLQADPNLTLEQLRSVTSRNGSVGIATTDMLERLVKQERRVLTHRARTGQSANVGLDLSVARAQPKVQGDDATGYKVTLWPSAPYKASTYIVKEDGKYRVLATTESPGYVAGIGLEVLDRLAQNNLEGARILLDWLRDDRHLTAGDDPLAGERFPRLWAKGRTPDPIVMKLAAASLLTAQKETARQGIAVLEENVSAATESDKLGAALAYLEGYGILSEIEKSLEWCLILAKQHPESTQVFLAQMYDLALLRRFDEAYQLAQDRLKRISEDRDAIRGMALVAVVQGNYSLAHTLGQKLIDQGSAETRDLNRMAWHSLFIGRVEPADVEAALKGAQLSNNNSSILHTLGCVYAELGKAKEAREVLVQAMDELNLDEPDEDYWYAFGRIAEQYGEREAALTDYARVAKPKKGVDIPDSSYLLAQIRLKALGAAPTPPASKK